MCIIRLEEEKKINEVLDPIRSRDIPITTINGCFDILTPGHLKILCEAYSYTYVDSAFCSNGPLVVGLNSDISVRKMKGEGRPVLSEMERAYLLHSLGYVHCVIIFDDLTCENFIRKVRPQIHVNDSSYGQNCVEKKVLDEYGGELVLFPKDTKSFSTTDIVNRILKKNK